MHKPEKNQHEFDCTVSEDMGSELKMLRAWVRIYKGLKTILKPKKLEEYEAKTKEEANEAKNVKQKEGKP